VEILETMTPALRDIPRETLRGYLFIVLAAFCWGGIGPVSRYAFSHGMAPLEVAFWRALFGWVVFGLQAVKMRQWQSNTAERHLQPFCSTPRPCGWRSWRVYF
jgi:drug/metabolite transporter (DMT)-like permease